MPSSDEVHQLQMRASQVTEESLDSTRRMMNMCEEAQDSGAQTLQSLEHQGEQLDRIEEGMDQINADMKEAEKNLQGMEKCCGLCALPCKRSSKFKEDSDTWRENEDGRVVNNQPQRVLDDRNGVMGGNPPVGGHISRITNDAREDDMEDNMIQVSNMVGNLKNMAQDMGQEIGNQNQQLDRINAKGQSNVSRVDAANQRTGKLLKS